MKFENHNPDVEAVGFVIHADGFFEFANPCSVPIEMLETVIKTYKKQKPKKHEITAVGFINLPFKLKHPKKSGAKK